MTHKRCARRRNLYTLLTCAGLALLTCAPARAQGMDSSQALTLLMEHRREMSSRAVTETQRRRFEDGKSDTRFPSDANKVETRPGVVREVTHSDSDYQKTIFNAQSTANPDFTHIAFEATQIFQWVPTRWKFELKGTPSNHLFFDAQFGR